MKNIDVVALGELLIDFTSSGLSNQNNPLLEANPGGAPCNLLAMLTKFNHSTAFFGKVGNDGFGRMLKTKAESVGVNMNYLKFDDNIHTTLAFVDTLENGDREFSFYRKPGADIMLREDEIDEDVIASCKIFHYGTLSLTDEPCRSATLKAIEYAKKHSVLKSFDPNIRIPLWNNLDEAKEQMAFGLRNCDILKISDNEIEFFTGLKDLDKGIEKIISEYKIPLVFATYGRDGSAAYYHGQKIYVKAFINKDTIETTGAGDTFGGCVLHFVLKYGLDNLSKEILKEALTFANAAASIVTTRKGALCVMPEVDEVNNFIKNYK